MRDAEYEELFAHLRRRVREAGWAAFDDEVVATLAEDAEDAREMVLAYVERMRTVVRLRSGLAVSEALDRLNRFARAQDGPIEGAWLHVEERDRFRYGEQPVDLTRPRMDADALGPIEELLALVTADDEPPAGAGAPPEPGLAH